MSQQLDSFSKILIATSTINYMASTLNGVAIETAFFEHTRDKSKSSDIFNKTLKESVDAKFAFLKEMSEKLNEVVEELGNFLNDGDIVCPIDLRINSVPCNILLRGMDETEKFYTKQDKVS